MNRFSIFHLLSFFFTIGLIYENTNPDLEKIFHLAIGKANEENEELKLHGVAVAIEPSNAFETSKKLCKILRVGKNLCYIAIHSYDLHVF